jgi:hypothetical protein
MGAGNFSSPLILPQSFAHYWVGVADFNGDGYPDLIGDGSTAPFYAGSADGTFAPPVNTISIPYGAVIGDFNGDGKMDIAYLINTFNRERVSGQQISFLMGPATASFSTPWTSSSPVRGPARWQPGTLRGPAAPTSQSG